MEKYLVRRLEVYEVFYEVEANSPEEALEDSEETGVEQYRIYNHQIGNPQMA